MTYIVAMMVGFTIVISIVQNARLEQSVPLKQVTLMNFITGTLGATVVLLVLAPSLGFINELPKVPIIGYIGAALGVGAVTLGTIVMRHISVIAASMLMYTGQMLTGFLIDYFRGTEISTTKIVGCGLIILGVYFNSLIDRKTLVTE